MNANNINRINTFLNGTCVDNNSDLDENYSDFETFFFKSIHYDMAPRNSKLNHI